MQPVRVGNVILLAAFLFTASAALSFASDFADHWARPAAAWEGTTKAYPEDCAVCHGAKFSDWSASLHAESVGPGLLTQLHPVENPSFAASCYFCHAPALEQAEMLRAPGGFSPNKEFDERLKKGGVSCIACHMRKGTVFGPDEPHPEAGTKGPHTTVRRAVFESSDFCAACHQLEGGFSLNGKPLTNTYREWKESYYGKNGISCQSCHMPDGRHLFKGIHDRETVLGGLDIKAVKEGGRALLTIKSARVGHYFPTYVTPLVVVKGFLEDGGGKPLEGTLKTAFIGRKVKLNLSAEEFDTRIAPLDTFSFAYDREGAGAASSVVFEIWVRPDEFYYHFFKSYSNNPASGFGEKELASAIKNAEESVYLLYRKAVPLAR